jgi:hypothetical protein
VKIRQIAIALLQIEPAEASLAMPTKGRAGFAGTSV